MAHGWCVRARVLTWKGDMVWNGLPGPLSEKDPLLDLASISCRARASTSASKSPWSSASVGRALLIGSDSATKEQERTRGSQREMSSQPVRTKSRETSKVQPRSRDGGGGEGDGRHSLACLLNSLSSLACTSSRSSPPPCRGVTWGRAGTVPTDNEAGECQPHLSP